MCTLPAVNESIETIYPERFPKAFISYDVIVFHKQRQAAVFACLRDNYFFCTTLRNIDIGGKRVGVYL
jgi:hypothetical protein